MTEANSILADAINNVMEDKLMQLSTAFFGKITALSDKDGEKCALATVQPLNKMKRVNDEAIDRSVVTNIPVLYHARYRLIEEERDCLIDGNQGCTCSCTVELSGSVDPEDKSSISGSGQGSGTVNCSCTIEKRKHLKKEWIKPGDIAFCVCADRDISSTKNGESSVPKPGQHHELKDAVLVGVLW